MNIIFKGAATINFEQGRRGNKIDKIILHWIVGTLESADATFANPQRVASAHYGIGDGEVHQYVNDQDTAYHAGNFGVNLTSIGIEHEGGWEISPGVRMKPSDKTHETSGKLVAALSKKYNIPLTREHIKGHKEVSLSGTECPGTLDIDRIIKIAKTEGGDNQMGDIYKGYDLANKESMKVAVDILVRVQGGEFVDKAKFDELQQTITNLNGSINSKNTELLKLTDELSRKIEEIAKLNKEKETAEDQAKEVPTLRKFLEQCELDRKGFPSERESWNRARGQYEARIKELENNWFKAFIGFITRKGL